MDTTCKICGTETYAIIQKKLRITYHRCPVCDFISKESSQILTPEEEFAEYNLHQNSLDDSGFVAYFKRFIDNAIIPFVSPNPKGLDFGSGPSPVLAEILKRDYHFDMDIYDLFYAPEKLYSGQTYDLVTSTEVVEHLMDPLEYFKLFHTLLNPDGLLSIMTQFHPQTDQDFLSSHYVRDMTHISFFSLKTMEVVAEKVGLTIVYTDGKRYTSFRKSK